jgi:hypothetical protein
VPNKRGTRTARTPGRAVSAGRYRDLTEVLWPYVTEDKYLDLVEERDDLVEERDGLRAENERLRAALSEIGLMTDATIRVGTDPEGCLDTVHAKSMAVIAAPPAAPARRAARHSYAAVSGTLGPPGPTGASP